MAGPRMRFTARAIKDIREQLQGISEEINGDPEVAAKLFSELGDILKNRRTDSEFGKKLWLIADVNFALWYGFYSGEKISGSVAVRARELTVEVVLLALRHWLTVGNLAVRID